MQLLCVGVILILCWVLTRLVFWLDPYSLLTSKPSVELFVGVQGSNLTLGIGVLSPEILKSSQFVPMDPQDI